MTKIYTQTKGFTFIELMMTLAVAAILLSVAIPNFRSSIQNNRMVTQINELQTSLSLARSEAVKRSSNIAVCRSSNGTSCTGNWEDGWIVFVDGDVDGAVDEGEEILRVHGGVPGDVAIAFSQTLVTYRNNGLATDGVNGTFTLCDARGAESAKGLIIGPSGRARLATGSEQEDLDCS